MTNESKITEEIILGEVSAYALAVKYGYEGTEEEWAKAQQKFHDESQKAAEAARKSASTASTAAYQAVNMADAARSWARGSGGEVREGDETDNSEFYSRQSHNSAELSKDYYQKTKQTGDNAINAINNAMNNINQGIPKFWINPNDGKLYHTPSRFIWRINRTTGQLEWGLAV